MNALCGGTVRRHARTVPMSGPVLACLWPACTEADRAHRAHTHRGAGTRQGQHCADGGSASHRTRRSSADVAKLRKSVIAGFKAKKTAEAITTRRGTWAVNSTCGQANQRSQ